MLTWHPAREVPVTCLRGGILLARRVVRALLATGTVLELTAGMFLGIQSDMYIEYYEIMLSIKIPA